jgi:hypothetical protein
VKFHVVEGAMARMEFLAEELRLLYATAGIDLALVEGERIAKDPTYHVIKYIDWIKRFGEQDRSAGHLILGRDVPDYRSDIAGRLIDEVSRGVAVVYTSCDYIQRDGEGALLQTCAHEIGHMLNLSHDDVDKTFVTAMNQADKRDLDTRASWESVKAEAREIRNTNEPDYFLPPARELASYPFAYRARHTLNNLSPDRLLPWGGKFEHLYDGTEDKHQKEFHS